MNLESQSEPIKKTRSTIGYDMFKKKWNLKIIVVIFSFLFLIFSTSACITGIFIMKEEASIFAYILISCIGFASNILSYIIGNHYGRHNFKLGVASSSSSSSEYSSQGSPYR